MKKLLNNRAFLWAALCVCALLAGVLGFLAVRPAFYLAVSTAPPTPSPTLTPSPMPTPSPTPTPSPSPTPEPYFPPEELTSSQALNPHVIAWMEIPDTAIRYPVLLHPTEDNYYLNITIEGGYGYPGSVYTNSMEGRDFETFNTVLYGHNMADGSYFGSLKNYNDADFCAAHREIDIYTPDRKLVYKVCAVVTYDDRYITDFYDDSREADRAAFLRSLRECGAVTLDNFPADTQGHILTLSTCIGGMPNNRLLIVAAEEEPALS